jgi:hypothetical protein
MNHAIVMAMIPLPLLAWASWPQEQPIEVRTVQSEGIRAQRQDTETFTARWRPVYLAPVRSIGEGADKAVGGARPSGVARANTEIEGRTVPSPMVFAPAVYRSEPVTGGDAQPRENASKPVEAAVRTAPPARLVRRAALRGVNGVCAKHGMHTVHYGRRWRCRK